MSRLQTHFLLIFILAASFSARAQNFASEIKLQTESFLSPYYETSKTSHFQFLKLRMKSPESDTEKIKLDVRGLFSFNSSLLNSLNVKELYYQSPTEDGRTGLLIGRKSWDWSGLDQRWDFGVWEPVSKWNPLSPESQGLTGLTWFMQNNNVRLMLFASPIFIPSQGPQFEINEDGQFTQANPWYKNPPKSVKIFAKGDAAEIEYRIQKPSESQVVFHSTYAGQLQYGADQGLKASLSYAYKPMNQLLLAYDGILNVAKNKAEVDVQPFVLYHSLTAVDLSYLQKKFRLGVSALKDDPQNSTNLASKWTRPVLSSATSLSPFVEFDFNVLSASLSYIRVEGGDLVEEGSLASNGRMTLNSVYRFKEATNIALKSRIRIPGRRVLRSEVSWTQSSLNKFEMVDFSSSIKLSKFWSVFGGLQLVKAEEQTIGNRNEVAEYANNDRFLIGAGYVF